MYLLNSKASLLLLLFLLWTDPCLNIKKTKICPQNSKASLLLILLNIIIGVRLIAKKKGCKMTKRGGLCFVFLYSKLLHQGQLPCLLHLCNIVIGLRDLLFPTPTWMYKANMLSAINVTNVCSSTVCLSIISANANLDILDLG